MPIEVLILISVVSADMSATVDLRCIAPHSMSAEALSIPIGAANTADTAIGSYAYCNMILHIIQGVAICYGVYLIPYPIYAFLIKVAKQFKGSLFFFCGILSYSSMD